MNTALLLSGGIGSRLPSDVPKQYIRVEGKMLITYALAVLADAPDVDEIWIVAEDGWRETILADAAQHHLSSDKIAGFASPGPNRQTSILNGMREALRQRGMDADGLESGDTIFIHDAARPLLTQEQIRACYTNLRGHDGVLPVLPMKDTVYFSRTGRTVSELLDREKLFAGQAPELFCFPKYYQANLDLLPDKIKSINGSTEPAILAGMDIVMIPGEENNFKITTQADLDRFRTLIEKREQVWK